MSSPYSDESEGPDLLKFTKPDIPYRVGKVLEIRRHVPPLPRGSVYRRPHRWPAPELVFPPGAPARLPAAPNHHPEAREGGSLAETDELRIDREMRVGNGRASQIVVCERLSSNSTCIAKIYDPLYALKSTQYSADNPHEAGRQMDYDYSNEVAAYEELDARLGGTVIPRYYGSWTTSMEIITAAGPSTRIVCLILIEHIPGTCLMRIKDSALNAAQRSSIMAGIVHCATLIYSCGIEHEDLAPRNVIACDVEKAAASRDPTQPRVVVLDFNQCMILRLRALARGYDATLPYLDKPISPIEHWWWHTPSTSQFGPSWFPGLLEPPDNKEVDIHKWRTWLWDNFGGSPRYRPPPADMSRGDVNSNEIPCEYDLRNEREERAAALAQGLPDPCPWLGDDASA